MADQRDADSSDGGPSDGKQDWAARLQRALVMGGDMPAATLPQAAAPPRLAEPASSHPGSPVAAPAAQPPVAAPAAQSPVAASPAQSPVAASPASELLGALNLPQASPPLSSPPIPDSAPQTSLMSFLEAPATPPPPPETAKAPPVSVPAEPPPLTPPVVTPAPKASPLGSPPPTKIEPPFTAVEFATAHAALLGAPPGTAMAAAEPGARDEWIALARSIATAEETWYGLFLGSRADKLVVSAGLGARHNKLAPRLQAVEADPIAFSRLHAAIEAQAFTADEVRLLQAEISATPAESPPRAATVQDLLAEAPRCDLLHIGARGLVVPLVDHALDLLESRVRWLVIKNRTRAEENRAIVRLSPRGWQLLADHPCTLDLLSPRHVLRLGTQVWRGPLV